MIKNFIVGHRPSTGLTMVTASFPFAVYLFCFVFFLLLLLFFQKITKQKHQVSHFYLFFCQKKWNLGRNLYIFIHPLISSKSNELPQFGPPLKQMNG